MSPARPAPAQSISVYPAAAFRATDGANMGDALSFAAELMLDDSYALAPGAVPERLSILTLSGDRLRLAADTGIGTPGAEVHLDCTLTLMSGAGQVRQALVLVEVDGLGHAAGIYLLPLGTLAPRTDYQLVGVDTENTGQKFGQVGCVSFTRGTHIALGSGELRRIEDLRVGDRILTRDDGVQPLRWIGQSTLRAVGDFAPIRIRAGTLNNEHDLIVSPEHRLFIYQRRDEMGAGRSELLVKARHLVNGDSVTVQDGGFVDYFQLLFDGHQIIYAEGIAAESMLVDSRTRQVLPPEMSAAWGEVIPGHSDMPHAGLDLAEALLDRPDAAELLRKASGR